jgi:hypothetical protein
VFRNSARRFSRDDERWFWSELDVILELAQMCDSWVMYTAAREYSPDVSVILCWRSCRYAKEKFSFRQCVVRALRVAGIRERREQGE